MTITGQLIAKPPVSPHANLTATTRIGTTKSYNAIWQVVCTCGETLVASAPAIKRGGSRGARCKACNLSPGEEQAKAILNALPGTYSKIAYRTKLTDPQVRHRIDWMRERDMCHIGGWDRAEYQGSFSPIFHAGPGEDVPCKLVRRTDSEVERRYWKRVKKAIKKAEAGGKVDDRYARHIALHKASKTIKQARKKPHNPFSALFVVAEQGGAPHA